jgi:cell division protein FtsZ
MDRRHFLHIISAHGVTSFLPIYAGAQSDLSRIDVPTKSRAVRNGVQTGFRAGVVGVGRAGLDVLSMLIVRLPTYFRMIAISTVAEPLENMPAHRRILVGGVPHKRIKSDDAHRSNVRRNAWAASGQIDEAVTGLDVVLVVAGMGCVAGTVLSTVVAQVARKRRIFTIGIPILPFDWEGEKRNHTARNGAREFGHCVHSLYPIHNDAMARDAGELATVDDVFSKTFMAVRELCLRETTDSRLDAQYARLR